jgi:hypothetical protein
MIVPYKFTYLFGSTLFFIYWFLLFWHLKESRRTILIFSLLFAVLGPMADALWFTADWWRPEAAFGRITLIENIILGFTNGGIAATLVMIFYKIKDSGNREKNQSLLAGAMPLILAVLSTSLFYWFFNLSSFYATLSGAFVTLAFVYFNRPDLVKISLINGVLMLVLAIPVYLAIIFVSPGWIEKTWLLDKLSGMMILNIPIEDIVWYFLTGCIVVVIEPFFRGHGVELKNVKVKFYK